MSNIIWERYQNAVGQNRSSGWIVATMMANRNGFFSVLDRTDGKVLLAKPFIKRLTWASGIGADGRPLWHFVTNGENKASPMTYMVGRKQFVAIAIGPNILCFGLATGSEAK